MNNDNSVANKNWPTLAQFPIPAKALVSVVILTMAVAMVGALGQIIIHDIIPTFFTDQQSGHSNYAVDSNQHASEGEDQSLSSRGDLFSESPAQAEKVKKQAFYKNEQFVWTLKWSHIHLFGMNMIFIFMGAITIFLNISLKSRTCLIVLPFAGVLVDIATMWLKGYISPAFFWLHIPGGGLFGIAFVIVSARAFWELWWMRSNFSAI